jgi:uncharacterized protein DUF1801
MVELKTKENNASVDAFLDGIADEQKREDSKKLRKLFEEITGDPAKMWGGSIVGFGTYHYKYKSGREGDWMVTGFSPRKNALTLYIMDLFDSSSDLLAELGDYKTGKGCLYIKKLEDVDVDTLRELVTRSVKRVKSGMLNL